MLTIGVETSVRPGSVALVDQDRILQEVSLDTPGNRHGKTLLPVIEKLLREHDRTVADVECIAVSLGPGSFTGIRVGVVTAKLFAYTTNCRLVGVNTFDAIARGVSVADINSRLDFKPNRLFVFGDAQRGGLFVSQYTIQEANWKPLEQCELWDRSSLIDSLTDHDVLVGPGLSRYRQEVESTSAIIGPNQSWYPTAGNIALIASTDDIVTSHDPFQLLPQYVRASAAEEKRSI